MSSICFIRLSIHTVRFELERLHNEVLDDFLLLVKAEGGNLPDKELSEVSVFISL